MVVAERLPSGLRLVTETMPHVRSVTVGVWLACGSRHESDADSGMAHFVEHMLFKGTTSRSARVIAETVDSIGGHLDAFTAKEHAAYYVKVLDEHLPLAITLLSDMVLHPALAPDDVVKEQGVILEEIKMVEDAPDDLVHEVFTRHFWSNHPLGRPILGTPDTVSAFSSARLREYFNASTSRRAWWWRPPGISTTRTCATWSRPRSSDLSAHAALEETTPPLVTPSVTTRQKDIEQSHVCLGTPAVAQAHEDRYVLYVLNTILGGSMSSRLFQHIREERGLAYAVFSNLTTYSDAGMLTVYAGCASDKVDEVIELTLAELRAIVAANVHDDELRRAKDHLKGSLMLSLESTSSRMSHLARQELYFGRHFGLDEMLAGIERVTAGDVRRVAEALIRNDGLVATVVGPSLGWRPAITNSRVHL